MADRIFIVSKGVFISYATLKLFENSPAQPGVFVGQKVRVLLAQHADDKELDPNFFNQVIKGVVLMERCTIRLRLWNGIEF